MKRFFAVLTLAALAFAVPAIVVAQDDMNTQTVSGRVVSVSGDTLVLRTNVGEQRINLASLTNRPSNLAADSTVTVTYRVQGSEWVASNVAIDADRVATTSTTTTTTTTVPPPSPATTAPTYTTSTTSTRTEASTSSAANDSTGGEALPATASKVPAFALVGGLLIGAGLLLRRTA
jgi:thiol:disulfide interchange protein